LAVLDRQAPILWQPKVAGVLAAALVYSLREAGFLTGFLAVAVAVLCVVFVPGPRRVAERLLLVFALALGWLPLLGWLPGLGNAIDVPGMILAVGVGVACWHQLRPNRASPRIVSLPTLPEWLALGAWLFVTTWWWLPLHRFSRTGLLSALFIGWDNDTHFSMFRSNLSLGSFIQVRPTLPDGQTRLGADYPQGVHQAWAQFTRLLHPHPSTDLAWLLHAYVDVLVLTAGGIVLVGCLAVCRLARRDLLAALPAMALVVALFGLGRFGPFNGFPNFELAIVASAVAISLVIRPSMRPLVNFVAVAGMGLIVVYNWYPLFVLIAPAVIVTSLRGWRATVRYRGAVTGLFVATGIAYVLPAISFLHRGITWLNVAGGGGQAVMGTARRRSSDPPRRRRRAPVAAPRPRDESFRGCARHARRWGGACRVPLRGCVNRGDRLLRVQARDRGARGVRDRARMRLRRGRTDRPVEHTAQGPDRRGRRGARRARPPAS
jgi:hypothetical protein